MKKIAKQSQILIGIRLLHTVVWLFVSLCIVAIPFAAAASRLRVAGVLSGIVLVECLILAANRCRCPLTDLAEVHTDERSHNFDIYLPVWLAQYTKVIFGSLFVAWELFALARWMFSRP